MDEKAVLDLMNQYVEAKAQIGVLESEKKRLINEAMPKEVRDRVAEIEAEFAGKVERAEEGLVKQEEAIKEGVVSLRQAVAVKGLKATFHPGRVTWDAKGLEEVVESNPDVAKIIGQYKKQGKEYASFRFE
jgi:phage host-nuclease inhibitor protein Gam